MNYAQKVVALLLETGEIESVCAGCQKEFGVEARSGQSHGYCKRHLIDQYKQMLVYPNGKARAEQQIAQIQQRPDSDFPPDLAQQRNQPQQPAQAVPA
jgi:hypothetical protein